MRGICEDIEIQLALLLSNYTFVDATLAMHQQDLMLRPNLLVQYFPR